jgi:hypothetical protein
VPAEPYDEVYAPLTEAGTPATTVAPFEAPSSIAAAGGAAKPATPPGAPPFAVTSTQPGAATTAPASTSPSATQAPPTPTPPPTAPPTTAAPTTTAAPPALKTWNLGRGLGNFSVSFLPLGSQVSDQALPNYDIDRDSHPGLNVNRGDGLTENDAAKMQRWSAAMSATTRLAGTPTLDLWVGTKDFDDPTGQLDVGIYDCGSFGGCSLLSSATGDFDQSQHGGTFGRLTVSLPPIDVSIAAGRSLVLKVAPTDGSADDLWLAYGTTAYPSALHIG